MARLRIEAATSAAAAGGLSNEGLAGLDQLVLVFGSNLARRVLNCELRVLTATRCFLGWFPGYQDSLGGAHVHVLVVLVLYLSKSLLSC
jgi:hypothetical protein